MKKQVQILMLAIVVILFAAVSSRADVPTTAGAISKVTVYRGQALVRRTIKVDLPAGSSELIVNELPAKMVPESLYAQTSDDIKVLSVRYREKAVEADTRAEVKQLDDQISEVKNQLYHTERKKQHLGHQWSMFRKLRNFTIDATKADLNRGLLTFEPINQLVEFIQKQGQEYIEQTLAFEDEIKELKTELELLNRKRAELDAGRSRTERQAVLFISNGGKKAAVIELSYLVNGANWLPQYNLRANTQKPSVLIEYNAVVNQRSGEDWDGVELSLSTAEPTMVAAAPGLKPMPVILSRPRPSESEAQQQALIGMAGGLGDFSKLLKARRQQARKGRAAQVQLDLIAASNQALELIVNKRELAEMKQQVIEIARTEGVSVTYGLPGKLTLPSRTDQQLVSIATATTKADFTHIATPLLTDYVYLQAKVLNDSDTVFLSGQAGMFRNGEFVGKSQLPLVTIGEEFTAGFGIDSQLQVVRELEDKKTRTQGANRIDTYFYRIAVSNYKNTAVELQLFDRLAYSDNSSIKIELGKTEPALSKDSEYLRTARKKGILRWDLNLKPNTINDNVTVVKYSFTMEYDKGMQIQPRR